MKSLTIIAILSLFGSAFALLGPEKEVLLIIDPGHGGKDSGAQVENLKEAQLNLIWALELKQQAEEAGIRTLLTRESDHFLDLQDRVDFNNSQIDGNTIFISLHQDMHNLSSISGSRLRISEEASEENIALAQRIAEDLNIEIEEASLYVLNEASCPSLMISLGFISNPSDLEKMTSESYRFDFNELLIESLLN